MKTASWFAFSLLLAGALPAAADSLWTDPRSRETSWIADHRASRVGDILTIVVQESSVAQNTQKSKTGRDTSAQTAIERFLFAASGFGKHRGELPGTDFSAGSEFSASGEVNTRTALSTRAAVLVTEVLPNGNLVIEGARMTAFAGERGYASLSGVVRQRDVTADNTVLSSNVAHARFEFISEGSLTDGQRKGWLTRLYETLRPY